MELTKEQLERIKDFLERIKAIFDNGFETDVGIIEWANSEIAKLPPEKSKLEEAEEYRRNVKVDNYTPDRISIKINDLHKLLDLYESAISELQDKIDNLKAEKQAIIDRLGSLLGHSVLSLNNSGINYLRKEIKSIISGGR